MIGSSDYPENTLPFATRTCQYFHFKLLVEWKASYVVDTYLQFWPLVNLVERSVKSSVHKVTINEGGTDGSSSLTMTKWRQFFRGNVSYGKHIILLDKMSGLTLRVKNWKCTYHKRCEKSTSDSSFPSDQPEMELVFRWPVPISTKQHMSLLEHIITSRKNTRSPCQTVSRVAAGRHAIMYPHPARQQTACTPPKHTRMIPSPTDPSKSVPVKFTAILLFPSMSLWALKRFPSGPTLVCCLTHDAMYVCSKCTSV